MLSVGPAPHRCEIEALVQGISQRVGRALERLGRLMREIEHSYPALEPGDESATDALPGHSITYRFGSASAFPETGRNPAKGRPSSQRD